MLLQVTDEVDELTVQVEHHPSVCKEKPNLRKDPCNVHSPTTVLVKAAERLQELK